jgi:hypothetical protein
MCFLKFLRKSFFVYKFACEQNVKIPAFSCSKNTNFYIIFFNFSSLVCTQTFAVTLQIDSSQFLADRFNYT